MTQLLETALRKAAALPPDEQDEIASQIIETLEDEVAWKARLSRKSKTIEDLAGDAIREYRHGKTRPLDEVM